jgi:FO synthase
MSHLIEAGSAATRLQRLARETRAPLDAALDGLPLDRDAALHLLDLADDDAVAALLAVAGEIRTRHKGTCVTYSPKAFLPITNLCRDRCAYCTFRADPDDPNAWTMLPEEVRATSAAAAALGCIEGLMCLGDKPEKAFRAYRATLAALGCASTIEYVARSCEIALEEGLLPHTNAGVMTADELRLLKHTNVSMGLMLENVSPRLRGKGEAHWHAPDKDPQLRLAMMDEAGRQQIPFTTGLLLGIGETYAEVVDSLVAIRDLHARHGHIQEIIVQNFRAKATTAWAARPEPESVLMAKTIAVTRLLMPAMNVQAPPNLSPWDHRLFLHSGINDWGGISPLTPDFVNPEAPWPHIATLADTCRDEGFTLEPRLPVYAEFVDRPGFIDPALLPALRDCAVRRGVRP